MTPHAGVSESSSRVVGRGRSSSSVPGYAQAESYLSALDGARVTEKAFSFGVRGVGGKGRSALDLAIELGKRGDDAKLGVSERFARFTIGVNYSSALREY